ncbi:cell surface glycoprotein 1-like [Triticum aestivum]|uniref:cell surface glycoprotein 1-like n=1 Tax=Triticum aestivum TaxID=4565 RepID=UPI001D02E5F4|nr:cell surface glycoprotein 1-like [Triticum aestivum]
MLGVDLLGVLGLVQAASFSSPWLPADLAPPLRHLLEAAELGPPQLPVNTLQQAHPEDAYPSPTESSPPSQDMDKQRRTPEDEDDLRLDEEEVPLDQDVPSDEEEDVPPDEEEDVQHAHPEDAYPRPSTETSRQSQDMDKQRRTPEDEDDLRLDEEEVPLDQDVPSDEEEDVPPDEEEDVQHAHPEDAYPRPSTETSRQSQDMDKQRRTPEDEDDLRLDEEEVPLDQDVPSDEEEDVPPDEEEDVQHAHPEDAYPVPLLKPLDSRR